MVWYGMVCVGVWNSFLGMVSRLDEFVLREMEFAMLLGVFSPLWIENFFYDYLLFEDLVYF